VFQRCLAIIATSLQAYQTWEQNPQYMDEPDRTFIVVALDLLSGLTQGMGEGVHQLIATSQPPLLQLMHVCLSVSVT
jgi:transportin-1